MTLAILIATGVVHVWMILLLSFITGCCFAIAGPSYQAITIDLVEREDLANAIALNSTQFQFSRVVGPTHVLDPDPLHEGQVGELEPYHATGRIQAEDRQHAVGLVDQAPARELEQVSELQVHALQHGRRTRVAEALHEGGGVDQVRDQHRAQDGRDRPADGAAWR